MATDTNINELLERYFHDNHTPEEYAQLLAYFGEKSYTKEAQELLYRAMISDELTTEVSEDRLEYVTEGALLVLQQRIKPVKATLIRRLLPYVAAAVLILLGGWLYFYINTNNLPNNHTHASISNPTEPGKESATLTLSNGQKIHLTNISNGNVAIESGVIITKSADGQLIYESGRDVSDIGGTNTLTTNNGETYTIVLPDGSKVWLNAASRLTYSSGLDKQLIRKVQLHGEAYFEVAKDKEHPFIVQVADQEIEVLGTHFNVNAYSDEPRTSTTLIEGSVKITSGGENKIIKPGEQAYTKNGRMHVHKVDIESVKDWKEGEFYFDNVDLKVAMRKISRWYNIHIEYDDSISDGMLVGGWISRNTRLTDVLELIESSGLVHLKLTGQTIYVSR